MINVLMSTEPSELMVQERVLRKKSSKWFRMPVKLS